MGPQAGLSDPSSRTASSGGTRRAETAGLPRYAFVLVAAASTLLLVWLSRHVFLFWDDFVFLGEAREADLGWAALTDPLFGHFSPLVRAVNLGVVGVLPGSPWILLAVQSFLLAAVVSAVTWLMVVLHGRSWTALVASLVLSTSVCLLPLGNWWTAGVNIMPALAGSYVCFAAGVQVLRGRSRWWAVASLLGLVVGVLDYELPMLLPGYLGLWLLLCGRRVLGVSWWVALRRTWWFWVALFAVSAGAALNYRVNYYAETPPASPVDIVHALGRSLVRTLVPSLVGLHDPRTPWFSTLSLLVGCVLLVAVCGWLLWTRVGAWRGLLFGAVGWLLPSLALILNRVELFGVVVVDNVIYFHLPTVLFVVGLLEAYRGPRRPGAPRLALAGTPVRAAGAVGVVAVVAAYAWSVGPSSTYQLPDGASPEYVEAARASLTEARAELGSFTVVNSDVPPWVAPPDFTPWNRTDRVLGITAGDLDVDTLDPPYVIMDWEGRVVPVELVYSHRADATTADALRLRDAEPGSTRTAEGLCFTTTASTTVSWSLPAPVPGPALVARIEATVDRDSEWRLVVQPDDGDEYERANPDGHILRAAAQGGLETITTESVAAVRLRQFTPGAQVCIQSISVGNAVSGPAA